MCGVNIYSGGVAETNYTIVKINPKQWDLFTKEEKKGAFNPFAMYQKVEMIHNPTISEEVAKTEKKEKKAEGIRALRAKYKKTFGVAAPKEMTLDELTNLLD
jgi:hypothetical protein